MLISMAVVVLLACGAGCKLLWPIAFIGNPREKVSAEFDKLAGSRTAILVWAEPETLFHYPYVRLELSIGIRGQLLANVNKAGGRLEIVDPSEVENFIQRKRASAADPVAVGRHFNCDYVVFVELLRFQIRDPAAPELLHAKLDAAVSVHAVGADADQTHRYEISSVEMVHPARGPLLMTPTNPLIIRQQAYEKFSEQVARKFYDYTVEL